MTSTNSSAAEVRIHIPEALVTRQVTRREMLIETAALTLGATQLAAGQPTASPLRVCLLVERNFPREDAPSNLRALLNAVPNVSVDLRDAAAIASHGIDSDVFCNSHGSVYPAEIADKVYEFLARGGALLHVGGIPFGRAMTQKNGQWVGDDKSAQELREKLGIHTYDPAFPLEGAEGMRQRFHPALVGLEPIAEDLPSSSVTVTTTLPLQTADPALFNLHSITYLAKPVCRHTHLAAQLEDPMGQPILSSLLLTKTWRNPYIAAPASPGKPWAISTARFERPLAPDLFARLWDWVSTPAFLGPIELDKATLRAGEETSVTAAVYGAIPDGWKVTAQLASVTREQWKAGKPVPWTAAPARVDGSQASALVHDNGSPDAFLYCVRLLLTDHAGRVRDYSESAVVAWRPEALKAGPSLRRNGCYLDYSTEGKNRPTSFQIGTNWQDSEVYGLTWFDPNPLRVASDARSMAELGLRILRVHYVMPEFLRVLAADVFRRTSADFYRSFEAGPELTERHLRALEAHAMVLGQMGIVFMPTVYTCLGPSMGNCQAWGSTSERFEMPEMIEAQKAFGRQVMDRLGALPNISCDIINEPDVAMPAVGRWLGELRPIFAANGRLAGIGTSGLEQNLALGEATDWHSVHTNCSKGLDTQIFRTGKPHFYHEAWVHTEPTAAGEIEDEQILCQTMARTVVRGACGFMPWNWNKLLAYWRYGASETEIGDLTLGACAQGDGVRRRGWFALRDWATLLEGISFDQRLHAQIIHLYPRYTITSDRPQLWLEALRQMDLPCLGINDRDFADADIQNARFIIVPHFGMGYRRSTYERIMEFAAKGGTLWAHADSLRRDENGKLDSTRAVQFTNARIPAGQGAIEWYFGWSIPTKWEPGSSTARFERVVRSINFTRATAGTMPLADGELRFNADKELKVVRTVQIADGAGTVTRAWSGYGDTLEWPGIKLSSPGQLFVMRTGTHLLQVKGEQVRVTASGRVSATLAAYPNSALSTRTEQAATIIEPRGWQRGQWFEVRRS